MAAYLERVVLEVLLAEGWTALTADVLTRPGISVEYGIRAAGPGDRVASPGALKCTLRDNAACLGGREGYYTPGSPYCLPGFSRGLPLRLRLRYDGVEYIKFAGRITEIRPDRARKTVAIEAGDFFDLAASHALVLMNVASNLRINQVVPLITANMRIPPAAMALSSGQDVFPNVFDTIREQTTAAGEFLKVALSELGYVYGRFGRAGETLVCEGRYTRAERQDLTLIEEATEPGGRLLLEDGSGALWLESGEGAIARSALFPARLNVIEETGARTPARSFAFSHGQNVFNQVRFTVYPRFEDVAATTVLFSLNTPLKLAPGEVRENLMGYYRDPAGGASRVNGRNMAAPVAGTDYAMWTNPDGSGTNLTANLAVLAVYGAEGVRYRLSNTSGQVGYVTRLQARGRGIYLYDPLTLMVEDAASQDRNGVRALTLDLKYQSSIETAKSFADIVLATYRQERTTLDGVQFVANTNAATLQMFLQIEPGARVQIAEQGSGTDGDFFVQGVAYSIVDRQISVRWTTKSAADDVLGSYWRLGAAGAGELGRTTVLGY